MFGRYIHQLISLKHNYSGPNKIKKQIIFYSALLFTKMCYNLTIIRNSRVLRYHFNR
jgi:hypothetical protein